MSETNPMVLTAMQLDTETEQEKEIRKQYQNLVLQSQDDLTTTSASTDERHATSSQVLDILDRYRMSPAELAKLSLERSGPDRIEAILAKIDEEQ